MACQFSNLLTQSDTVLFTTNFQIQNIHGEPFKFFGSKKPPERVFPSCGRKIRNSHNIYQYFSSELNDAAVRAVVKISSDDESGSRIQAAATSNRSSSPARSPQTQRLQGRTWPPARKSLPLQVERTRETMKIVETWKDWSKKRAQPL